MLTINARAVPDSASRWIWLLLAVVFGLCAAILPSELALAALVLSVIIVLGALSPFAALIVMLLVAPLRTLIATEAAFQLPLDIGQLAVSGFLLAYLLWCSVRHQPLIQVWRSPLVIALLVFIMIVALSGFMAFSLSAWLSEMLKWVQILILVIVLLSFVRRREWEWLVMALVAAGVANAVVGIYEFFGGSGALHLLINDRFFRAFGTFGQPNPFGGFMGLLIPIAAAAALGYGRRAWVTFRHAYSGSMVYLGIAVLYALAAGVMGIALGMSWSRGAWLGVAASFVVMAFALPQRTRRGVILLTIMLGVFGLLWSLGLLPEAVVARITSSTQEFFAFEDVRGVDISPENYAVVERLAHWQAAINMLRANPLLGIGFGNYEVVYNQYRLINWTEPLGHAHNYYLNLLAEVGVLGLLGYGKVWAVIMLMTWRARHHPDGLARFVVIGLLGTWTYLGVHSVFDNLYVNNIFLHFGVLAGILAILYNQLFPGMKAIRYGEYFARRASHDS
ncbi:MAG: O-antigen ligase family protein [Anaerolineae bacterium]|nr:O-antigen ligase family protein [Anaerolineae bacterium]